MSVLLATGTRVQTSRDSFVRPVNIQRSLEGTKVHEVSGAITGSVLPGVKSGCKHFL